jgi:hypothetical protein
MLHGADILTDTARGRHFYGVIRHFNHIVYSAMRYSNALYKDGALV